MNVELKRIRTGAETQVLEAFQAVEDTLPGMAQTHAERRQRMGLFERDGLPHRRNEEWKYTDLRALVRELAPLSDGSRQVDLPASLIEGSVQIAIVDGALIAPAQLPDGLSISALGEGLSSGAVSLDGACTPDRAIDALNAAFVRDGGVLTVADGAEITTPIEVLFVRSGAASFAHARVHAVIENGAKISIIERHVSPQGVASQSTAVTTYCVREGADLSVLRVQDEGQEAVHLGEITFDLAAKAEAKLLHVMTGGKLARVETRTVFSGEEARFDVAGISMLAERQHSDLTLYVDHLVAHTESTETFKTVIDDAAKAVFQGKIVVAQDAQKVDAQMSTNALLLSETADMIAKPELEIFADDVSCAHGATCGDIDEDLMFYLLARGIPTNEARKLLLQAFLSEGADLFEDHPFEQLAFDAIEAWLDAHASR